MSQQSSNLVEILLEELNFIALPKLYESLRTKVQILVRGEVKLEICEGDWKQWKTTILNVIDDEMNDLQPEIRVFKILENGDELLLISEKLDKLAAHLRKVNEKYRELEDISHYPCDSFNELLQCESVDKECSLCLYYKMKVCCFGTMRVPTENERNFFKPNQCEEKCGSPKVPINSSAIQTESTKKVPEFDEFVAEINGNSLIVRVSKNSQVVTRMLEYNTSSMKEPNICRKKSVKKCCCGLDFQNLTDLQIQNNCLGQTYENSSKLPFIRGNLKYPARFNFPEPLQHNIPQNFHRGHFQTASNRNLCQQMNEQGFEYGPKIAKGIEIFKRGSSDPNSDVLLLKMGKKRNQIELEMRTPKGSDYERRKMESRGCQVNVVAAISICLCIKFSIS